MVDDYGEGSTSVRGRSFGGCGTCRSRHVKCDEARPSCGVCLSSDIICDGYEKNIFFDFENIAEEEVPRYRRPLFTETERRCMSDVLISSVHPRSALWHIARLEAAGERSAAIGNATINQGPFGVFKLKHRSAVPIDAHCSPDGLENPQNGQFIPPEAVKSNSRLDNSNLSPAQSPGTTQLPFSSFWEIPVDPFGEARMVLEDVSLESSFLDIPQAPMIPPFLQSIDLEDTMVSDTLGSKAVQSDAICLVKHYSSTILNILTPFRHNKTPWHILFLPNCKYCLTALTLGETIDSAALANFYGTLSLSASSMGEVYDSLMWREKGQQYGDMARTHTQLMLQDAYSLPKTYKYKDILMALITMIQVSIFSRKRDYMEHYFVEAEKFIRLRGLTRRKSRKVRLLHHCYAFERIFYESTVLSDIHSDKRFSVRKAVESSGLVVRGQDSMQFRLLRSNDLEQAMSAEKGWEEGENDLHLELPNEYSATLYPEIFGIPEQWLVLVSLVIRLGREKDAAERLGADTKLSFGEFLRYAKAIERRIDTLQSRSSSLDFAGKLQPMDEGYILQDLLHATRSALAIYFYRRIYDVEASILQPKVKEVCECLLRSEHKGFNGSTRLIWPAFIAACEAEDVEMQVSFRNWFTNSYRHSGLSLFEETLKEIEQVWYLKRGSEGRCSTWLDMLKQSTVTEQLNSSTLELCS